LLSATGGDDAWCIGRAAQRRHDQVADVGAGLHHLLLDVECESVVLICVRASVRNELLGKNDGFR
jgi:hypothetical protein